MIKIDECLKNFRGIKSLSKYNIDFMDIYLDLSAALKAVDLTDQQQVILYYIIKGFNYSEIERKTGIYRLTVSSSLKEISKKLFEYLGEEYTI